MPRFFFQIVQDGDTQEDDVGVELASPNDLQPFAVRRAAEVLLRAAELDALDWWLMEVRDEHQVIVGRISFVASEFYERDRELKNSASIVKLDDCCTT